MASSTDQAIKKAENHLISTQSIASETKKALNAILEHLDELRGARPTVEICDGKPDRTKRTIKKILDAAHKIFTRDGHAVLSLRKVADEAGIAVGNLTYHFPTKQALLEAMLREALAEFVEAHLAQFKPERDPPIEILLNVVEFYVRDARANHQFFYQLWGFAGSGEDARSVVRNLYRPIGRFIFYLVRAANPNLDDDGVRRAVLQIFSLEEGYKLFIGMGPDDSSAIKTAEADIRVLTRRIIEMG